MENISKNLNDILTIKNLSKICGTDNIEILPIDG